MIELNRAIPHFTATTQSGTVDSKTLLGKNVVIYFYPKDSTPGCTLESRAFRHHYAEFQQCNTEIIGVSRDSVKSHCNFIKSHDLNFSLISDEDESLCKLFDVLKQKNMMGKKYMGIERSTFLIDANGVLRQEWRDVSVLGHAATVLASVKKL